MMMMMTKFKLIVVSIILAEIIFLCACYLYVIKNFLVSSREIKKSNNLAVSARVNLNFKKIQKLPEAIIIGEAKCGKL